MSYIENYHHIVFRTKGSLPTIPEETKRIMLTYMYQVSKEMGVEVLRMNCYLNHVHLFVNLPATLALSDYVQKVKGTSSHRFKHHPQFPEFAGWERRYGSFSKAKRDIDIVTNYIRNQEEHHRKKSFQEELEELFGPGFFDSPYNRRDWLDDTDTPQESYAKAHDDNESNY